MEKLLTRREAADALRISEKTVARMQKSGVLPNVAPEQMRAAKYRESDVKKLLK